MNILESMQIVTFILGAFTTGMSVYIAIQFKKLPHRMSNALTFQLLAEGNMGLVTMVFSLNSMLHSLGGVEPGDWNSLPPEAAIFLRVWGFMGVGVTSFHLLMTWRAVARGDF